MEEKTHRMKTGAILTETKGSDAANQFAGRVRQAVEDSAVVSRVTRTTPVLILDITEWSDEKDVCSALVDIDKGMENVEIRAKGPSRMNLSLN